MPRNECYYLSRLFGLFFYGPVPNISPSVLQMRWILAVLSFPLFAGCASTQVTDVTWDKAALQELNSRATQPSSWETPGGVYRARAFYASMDSVVIESVYSLGQTPHPQDGGYWQRNGSVFWWREVRPSDVTRVSFRVRSKGRGFWIGARTGGPLVGVPALLFGVFMQTQLCGQGDFGPCPGFWWRSALVGLNTGGLIGGLLGAALGAKETTMYRFRPDTPEQMSVVIGVGPMARVQARTD